jgi:hypothetical protein
MLSVGLITALTNDHQWWYLLLALPLGVISIFGEKATA